MKKVIAIAIAVASAPMLSQSARADFTELKQGTAFTTATVVGAIVGGPVGFFVGALSGAYIGEQIKQVDKQQNLAEALSESQQRAEILSTTLSARNDALAASEQALAQLQELALDKLQLQVMFHTGSDTLTEQGLSQVESLAAFLQQNPHLAIQLNGHADPRGTDEYNNVLSQYRALAVQDQLANAGVDAHRIGVNAYGSGQSRAHKGDLEAYALERRVDIEIIQPSFDAMVMSQ